MIPYNLKRIKAIALDVDGVLSPSTIPLLGTNGIPARMANIKDGYAIQLAVRSGLRFAIISGARNLAVEARYEGLGVEDIYMGSAMKIDVFNAWLKERDLQPEDVLYMGDDIPDLQVMAACGCPCAPADAAPEVQAAALYVSPKDGGHGCVRDVVEQVLKAQGKWLATDKAFGW